MSYYSVLKDFTTDTETIEKRIQFLSVRNSEKALGHISKLSYNDYYHNFQNLVVTFSPYAIFSLRLNCV